MKKKRCFAGLLACMLAFGGITVYADEVTVKSVSVSADNIKPAEYYESLIGATALDENGEVIQDEEDTAVEVYTDEAEEQVEEEVIDESISSNPLKTYADAESEYTVEWEDQGDNGQTYVLTINTNYSYTNSGGSIIYATGAQVTNIKTDSKQITTNIEIPSEITDKSGNKVPVISIGEVAFDSCYATDIVVPGSVYEICDGAFANCPNLKSITMNCALDDGTGNNRTVAYLQGTSYKAMPTQLGDRVVADCPSLETAVIKNYSTIGADVLSGCTSLKNVDISIDEVYGINTSGKVNTTQITASIGDSAFEGDTALKEFTVADTVKTMGKTTFVNCTGLTKVNIGSTLASGSFTYEDFTGCTALAGFTVSESNKNYSVDDNGNLYNYKGTTLLVYPLGNTNTEFIIPEGVTSVDTYAATGQPYLKKLYINYNAISFGKYSFQSSALTDIIVADNFGCEIGERAFANCESLVNLDLVGWYKIGNYAFQGCTALKTITAGYGVGPFGNYVFQDCTGLTTADLNLVGYDLQKTNNGSFGTYTFDGCESLTYCKLPELLMGISSYTFNNCTALKKVDCDDNLAAIRSGAFNGCTALTTPPSPRFLVRIDNGAFTGCEALNSKNPYLISTSVKFIGTSAFDSTVYLKADPSSYAIQYCKDNYRAYVTTTYEIDDSEFMLYSVGDDGVQLAGYRGGFYSLDLSKSPYEITSIADKWIQECLADESDCRMTTYIQEMYTDKVETIGKSAFSGCTALKICEIPSVKIINESAFSGCSAMTTCDLPAGLEMIYKNAFQNCKSLEKIQLPNTLADISETSSSGVITTTYGVGENAFSGCTSVKSITVLGDGVTVTNSTPVCTLGKKAFYGCTANEVIELPDNVQTICESCFENNKSAVSLTLPLYCETIEKNAFKGCTSLTDIKFNPNLKKIGETSFANCTSLRYLTLDNAMLVQYHAFEGCSALERVIIYANANVSVENDPFVSNTDLTIVAPDASKAQTYVEYKNTSSDENTFDIELAEFVEVAGTARVKCIITAPDGVNVYKLNSNNEFDLMDIKNDYAIYGDVLKFEMADGTTEDIRFYVNNSLCDDGTYTVEETITSAVVTVMEINKFQMGDVDADGSISAADAALTLQYVLNPVAAGIDDAAALRADVNGDGSVAADDAASILQKTLNSSYEF